MLVTAAGILGSSSSGLAQQALQDATAELGELVPWEVVDWELDSIDGNQKYRTTITVSGGDPLRLIWRIPAYQYNVNLVRIALISMQEIVDEYGVEFICDRGLGCQQDTDGDGVLNEHDCDELNPTLRTDIDNDGLCDRLSWGTSSYDWNLNISRCESSCVHIKDRKVAGLPEDPVWRWQWEEQYLPWCFTQCKAGRDNCVDGVGAEWLWPMCQSVYEDLTGGRPPDPDELLSCQQRFANPWQEDENQDGIGDRCETGVYGLVFEPDREVVGSPSGAALCDLHTYRVSFRANSASVTGPEMFVDTSVESCHCNDPNGGADWAESCTNPGGTCDQYARDRWNPIRDPVFSAVHPYAPYPLALGIMLGSQLRSEFTRLHEMAKNRVFNFRRSEAENQHRFSWPWRETIHFPEPFDPDVAWSNVPEPLESDGETRPVKVRVAWANEVINHPFRFTEGNAAVSRELQLMYPAMLCGPLPYQPREFDQFWWLEPGPYGLRLPGLAIDPSPVALALAREPGRDPLLVTFHRSLARPSGMTEVQILADEGVTLRPEILRSTTGRLDYSLVGAGQSTGPAVFAYGPAGEREGEGAVLWIGLLGDEASLFIIADQALGGGGDAITQTPVLLDGAPLFDETDQRLYLLGHEWTGAGSPVAGPQLERNVLWSLDLAAGQWHRWGHLAALGDALGTSVTFDPIKRRLLVFGGQEGDASLSRLVEIRLDTLSQRVLFDGLAGDVDAGRSFHGATFDPASHLFYVYGGLRQGVPLSEGAVFDLIRGSWSTLPQGPTGRLRPVLLADGGRGALWVAGGLPGETGAAPWQLHLESGTWLERASLTAATQGRAVAPGEPLVFHGQVSGHASLPAEARLLRAESVEPHLRLRVTGGGGRLLGEDLEPGPLHEVLLLGQAGQGYLSTISTGPGYEGSQAAAVTFTDQEAALMPAGHLDGLWGVSSVAVQGGLAYLGEGPFVTVVDLAHPEQPVVIGRVFTGGLVQDVTPCGLSRLCVAQSWGQGSLVILDLADPRVPRVAASLPLPGLCRSVSASRSGLAYLGCGAGGVHMVSLDVPGGPARVDTLWPGAPVSTVKVAGQRLLVGLFSKRVKVYDLGSGSSPAPLAERRTAQHPLHILVLGSALHVSQARGLDWALCASGLRCGLGQLTEVLELDAQAGALDLVGSYSGEHRALPHGAFTGDLVVLPADRGLSVLRAERLP